MAGTEGVSKNMVAIYKNALSRIDSELGATCLAGIHYLCNNSEKFIETTAPGSWPQDLKIYRLHQDSTDSAGRVSETESSWIIIRSWTGPMYVKLLQQFFVPNTTSEAYIFVNIAIVPTIPQLLQSNSEHNAACLLLYCVRSILC